MELTNYWWLLIWLFGAGLTLIYLGPEQQEMVLGKMETRWRWGPALILALPYIIWAGFRINVGDTGLYILTFQDVPTSWNQIIPYLADIDKDKGYAVFSVIMKQMIGNSPTIFFLIIAIVQMGCLVYVFRRYSSNYFLSMFLFIVSTDYVSWMMNGMRQFIAVTMIFAGIELMIKKKYVPMILLILLASTIHGSALMMIPIIFIVQGKPWNEKTIMFIIAIMIVVMYIDQFTPLLNEMLADTQYNDLVTNEIWTTDDGTNLIRVAVYSIPALLSLIGMKYVNHANDPVINVCVNGSVVSMALYLLSAFSSGIYIGRLPIYTSLMGYISLPWLIDNIFTEKSARFVKLIMIAAYLGFFYYQMHIAWAML